MDLFYSHASPYARKVRIVVLEHGLGERVRFVEANPLTDPPELRRANPLGKVPALLLDDGRPMFDSPLLCEYLDSLSGGTPLLPASGQTRWAVLQRQALADGIMDAAVSIVMERRRPEALRSDDWIARWTRAILDGVAALDDGSLRVDGGDGDPGDASMVQDLGRVAAGVALAYLDFRLPDVDWRSGREQLVAWRERIDQRPSFAGTRPPQG